MFDYANCGICRFPFALLETPPPAAPPSHRQRSRFGRLGEPGTLNGSADEITALDEVTGLRDSRALWKELAQRGASCSVTSPLAVLMLDFDRLGEVNQRYNRSVGDAVLRRCAEVTGEEAPSARLVFRYRDDELVLLVPGNEEDGREVAERIRERIAAQNNKLPAITVSCGVAVLRAPVEPLVALGKGGPALQAAKLAGGNRVVLANELNRNGRKGHNGNGGGDSTAQRAALAIAVASLEARDRGTAAHSEEVVTLCESIGTRLGLSPDQLDRLAAAAQLHDVGKLAMPTEILNKPGPLDDDEWAIIREHTVIGERMLRAVPEMGAVASVVRHSHESWDGSGYPDGLAGEEIPLASRIILCADAFHAIRSDRPYRSGRPSDAALEEVLSCAGTQFDPQVVDALVAVARDVRRAARTGVALPHPRRLVALLAALIVGGGGSAYAASDDVRHAVDKVMQVVVPGTMLERAEAKAPDFSLRPIDEVPEITPVTALTADLEFPELRNALYPGGAQRAESHTGLPATAYLGEGGFRSGDPLAHVGDPTAEEQHPPQAPEASWPAPPTTVVAEPVSGVPVDLVVQPEPAAAPVLTPVPELDHVPAASEPDTGLGGPQKPGHGNPHGPPPGQIDKDKDKDGDGDEDGDDAMDEEQPHEPPATGNPDDTPPGETDNDDPIETVQDEIDAHEPPATGNPHDQADEVAHVVSPAPSIAEPAENIFVSDDTAAAPPEPVATPTEATSVPPSGGEAPTPPLPAVRPPEYVPADLPAETPTAE
jgi:diguanylate cyclase (GGDEF)-like protein